MLQQNELQETGDALKEELCDVNRQMNEETDTQDKVFEFIEYRFDKTDEWFKACYHMREKILMKMKDISQLVDRLNELEEKND